MNTRTFTGDTLAHLAAKSDHCFTLAFLSVAGLDLDLQDFAGHSPLQATVIAGRSEAARCLLQLRASPDLRDEGGRSIVALAAVHGQHALLDSLLVVKEPVVAPKGRKTVIPGRAEANVEAFKAGRKSLKEGSLDTFKVRRSMKTEAPQPQPALTAVAEDASPHGEDRRKEPKLNEKRQESKESKETTLKIPQEPKKVEEKKIEETEAGARGPKGCEEIPSEQQQEDEKARQERERLRSQKQEEEMPDLQLYWQAEALYKKLPKKFDLSVPKVLGELDNEGRTPLALAVQAGHHRVASVLLERKAMIDPVDKEGNTVLMLAASSPSRNALMIVELLLSLNADVQASNFEKLRAVDVAKAPKVRQLLRMQMDRLEVGQKLKSSQSLPALKD